MRILLTFFAISSLILVAGCDTFDQRTKEKAAVYAALSPEKQKLVKEGQVEIGDTEDVAYIALGKADEVKTKTTAKGQVKIWIYLNHFVDYAGPAHVGYERHVFFNPKTGKYAVALVPVEADVYEEHTEEALRVEFTDGKISAIEEAKPAR